MYFGFEPLVIAQMTLGAIADISFAIALGATLLGFGARPRALTIRVALLVWLFAQIAYLLTQASVMADTPILASWSSVMPVIRESHFGSMWRIGLGAGIVAFVLACVVEGERASGLVARACLVGAFAVMAFTHAGTTHAADAGDFSVAECVHALHLWTTAAWGGVVISAAWPLKKVFQPWSTQTLRDLRNVSWIATLTFAIAIGTGLANAWRELGGALAPLTSSAWGQLLCTKLVVVGVVVTIGTINRLAHLAHRRAIDRPTLTIVMRLLSIEAVLMVIVLSVASVLGHSIPAAVG